MLELDIHNTEGCKKSGMKKENYKKNYNCFIKDELYFPRIVCISSCMNAQGTVEPARGHLSPLGQNA